MKTAKEKAEEKIKASLITQLEKDVKRETYLRENKIDRVEGEEVTDEEYMAMIQALIDVKPDSDALPLELDEVQAMLKIGTIFRE
jgi:hypothetical protein